MAATLNTTTTTATFLVLAARDAMQTLKRDKGARPNAVRAFLEGDNDEQREDAVSEWGAGFTRRGLREVAVFFEAHDDEETANVFWSLRDSIDMDGTVTLDDETAVDEEPVAS